MVAGSATTDGFAVGKAFDRKIAKVGEACRQEGIAFIPVAADTGWLAQGGCRADQEARVSARTPSRRGGADRGATPFPEALPHPDAGQCLPPRQPCPY